MVTYIRSSGRSDFTKDVHGERIKNLWQIYLKGIVRVHKVLIIFSRLNWHQPELRLFASF